MIRLPRLLDAGMNAADALHPTRLSLEINLRPLSTARMSLPPDGPIPAIGQYIELFTPAGSAGIFRVQQTEETFTGEAQLYLEHSLVSLADSIIPAATDGTVTTALPDAISTILAQQTLWAAGELDVPADTVISWSYDHTNLLDALLSLMKELPGHFLSFDQRSLPWKLNVLPLPEGQSSECRLSRNLESLHLETDRSQLCTRLYLPGIEEPLNADTQESWGVVSRALSADPALTADELTALGQQYLTEHKHPQVSVTLSALDLSDITGEPMDRFTPGHLCRVCLPGHNTSIAQRVVSLAWPDLLGAPEQLKVTLANRPASASGVLSGLAVQTAAVHQQVVHVNSMLLKANERLDILAEEISLKADAITLEGYVTIDGAAEVLENATIQGSLWVEETFNAYTIVCTEAFIQQADIGSLTLADKTAAWKSQKVLTGLGTVSQSKRYLTLATPDGGSVSLDIVTDVSITPASATLNYLGQEA